MKSKLMLSIDTELLKKLRKHAYQQSIKTGVRVSMAEIICKQIERLLERKGK